MSEIPDYIMRDIGYRNYKRKVINCFVDAMESSDSWVEVSVVNEDTTQNMEQQVVLTPNDNIRDEGFLKYIAEDYKHIFEEAGIDDILVSIEYPKKLENGEVVLGDDSLLSFRFRINTMGGMKTGVGGYEV